MATQKKYCTECKRSLSEAQFYSKRDGTKYHKCKFCATILLDNSEPDTFIPLLKELDYMYLPDEWKLIMDREIKLGELNSQSVIGKYVSRMKLNQFKNYGFADSESYMAERDSKKKEALTSIGLSEEEVEIRIQEEKTLTKLEPEVEEIPSSLAENDLLIEEEEIVLTEEDKRYLVKKWGPRLRPSDYVYLEDFYQNMVKAYDISTPSHINYLENICRVSLKMRQTLEIDDIDGYNKLARTYDNLMKSAKFTAAQDKDRDNDSFSIGEFALLVEKTKGEIPRFPLKVNRDIVDKTLNDMKLYITRLVKNETNLGDLVDSAIKEYEKAQEEGDYEDLFGDEYDNIEEFDKDGNLLE